MIYRLSAIGAIALIACQVAASQQQAHPIVPGYERLQDDAALAGAVLISELNCAACHELPKYTADALPNRTRKAPVLGGMRNSNIAYIHAFLANAHAMKPGNAMPDMFAHESDREKTIEEIAAYLASLNPAAGGTDEAVSPEMIEEGDRLYHSVGCVACHEAFHEPRQLFYEEDDPFANTGRIEYPPMVVPSVPLGPLAMKSGVNALAAFLLEPHEERPGVRMPDMKLTSDEAIAIAGYIIQQTVERGVSVPQFGHGEAAATRGAEHIERLKCSACHTFPDSTSFDPIETTSLSAQSKAGCIDPTGNHNGPRYKLTDDQRTAIIACLQRAEVWSEDEKLIVFAGAYNCLACHQRDDAGGVDPGREPYFTFTIEADLGDEGRIPPTLQGVGAKLTNDALTRVIDGEGDVRPYMATRMPNFHFGDSQAIAERFAKVDEDPTMPATDVMGLLHHHRNHYGRELVGDQGLGCISCHNFNGHQSTGIPAIDLAYSPERLRPEWFKKYMLKPGDLRPGTRMPDFFPEGKSTFTKLFKGNAGQQIEAIWIYLREIDQTRLPSGLEQTDEYVLEPKDKPVVHRTFMKDVGSRAIAIGFPAGIHAAFDAKRVRFVMSWRGGFLDANATWNDRFSPFIEPLSDDRWDFLSVMPFAMGGDAKAPWPETEGAEAGYRFRGIRIDAEGVPILLYTYNDIEIEERFTPIGDAEGFKRSFTMSGVEAPLRYVVAVGAHVDDEGDHYRVNSDWTTKMNAPNARFQQVMAPNGFAAEICILEPADGHIEFSQEVRW